MVTVRRAFRKAHKRLRDGIRSMEAKEGAETPSFLAHLFARDQSFVTKRRQWISANYRQVIENFKDKCIPTQLQQDGEQNTGRRKRAKRKKKKNAQQNKKRTKKQSKSKRKATRNKTA